MSKNALILEKISSETSVSVRAELAKTLARPGEYIELIRRHFRNQSVVAIVAVGFGQGASDVCDNIALELAASGNRVVIVSVDAMLRTNTLASSQELGCAPGKVPNVWIWPSPAGGQVEFFKHRLDSGSNWCDSLRLNFDSVLLDCPATEIAADGCEIAAMADAAMLVVEAGRTTRQQVKRDQRALQLRGVKLAGCILIQRR